MGLHPWNLCPLVDDEGEADDDGSRSCMAAVIVWMFDEVVASNGLRVRVIYALRS